MNALAFLLLKLDAAIGGDPPNALKGVCVELFRTLHERVPKMRILCEDLMCYYSENIQKKEATVGGGDMSYFFDSYLEQVKALVEITATAREEQITAIGMD